VVFLFARYFVSHELILYSGRLDKLLYVPLPNAEERACILNALAGRIKLAPDVDLNEIGRCHRANGYSGADCAALLREAGLAVLKENLASPVDERQGHISARHFEYAFHHVLPSVSSKDQARYDRIRDRMARARTRAGGVADPPLETIKEEDGPAEDVPITS
jgi:ribosome biogenesis ATPase